MATAQPALLLDEITDFLAGSPTAQDIIAFNPSAALAGRALELLQRHRENRLSAEEHQEMMAFMQMDHFMTLLKAKARLKLVDQG